MSIQRQLEQEVRARSREAFGEAVRDMNTQFVTADNTPGPDGVPLDTGFLRSNFRVANISTNTDVLRATVEVEALNFDSSPAFDYGSYLNRIQRYTTLFDGIGPAEPGAVNEWFDWWDTWWGGSDSESERWAEGTQRAIDRSFTR